MLLRAPLFLLLAGLLGAAAMAPAQAGTVYRCEAADGSRSYASGKVKGAKCTAVGSYANAPAKSAPAPKAKPTTAKGRYLKKINLAATMSPGILLDELAYV